MKICCFYYKYPLYLKGSYFQEFLNKLALTVDKVYLVASRYPKGRFKNEQNIKIYWVPLLKLKYIDEVFFMFACLFRVIFTKQLRNIDIINSIGPRGLLAGLYLKWRFQIPLVCTIEMLNEGRGVFNNIYYRVVRFLMTKIPVDKYICWSNYYWKEHLEKWGIAESKIKIIPCGIDTEKYNPSVNGKEIKDKYAPNNILIVFAKPLYHQNKEAAKILVKAISVLRDGNVKLLIGGGEGQSEVYELAKKLEVTSFVYFMPPTLFTDIPKYIAASDIIVLPFIYAPTTSRSLIEAMAIGKPIITNPVGEITQVLEDKKNAIFVTLDPNDIANAIKNIIYNDTLKKYLSNNVLDLVKKRFSLERTVNREIELFSELSS